MRWIRNYSIAVLACLSFGLLTACNQDLMQVTIVDQMTKTVMEVKRGTTVKQILDQAEIKIGNSDKVEPSLEEVLVEANTPIVIEREIEVIVTDGKVTKTILAKNKTVSDVIAQADIALGENDYLNHDRNAYISDGMSIVVTHRLATTIEVDHQKIDCLTKATTVEELLKEQHIVIDQKDRVSPKLSENLQNGQKVIVERVNVKSVTEKEPIAFETMVEYSASMYEDQKIEKTPGVEGVKQVEYDVTYVDGKEESRKAVKETVMEEPVSQVVVQGTMKRRRIITKEPVDDCDGSGHGYYIITWSDGTIEYQEY